MADIYTEKNDDRKGVYYMLDWHDYENLPLEKVRVYATDARWDPQSGRFVVWSVQDSEDMYAIKMQDYIAELMQPKIQHMIDVALGKAPREDEEPEETLLEKFKKDEKLKYDTRNN